MFDTKSLEVGKPAWVDLTVEDADGVRDFYQSVIGWKVTPVDMGGYSDYCMDLPKSGKTTAGVCHARGVNAELPTAWLVYFTVADLEASMKSCKEQGGEVLTGPKSMGPDGRYAVIKDPAGAVAALFEPDPKP